MYVGPDQAMPVASLLAMLFGLILSFWRRLLAVFKEIVGKLKHPQVEAEAAASAPSSSSSKDSSC
jgi:hypothetical protein